MYTTNFLFKSVGTTTNVVCVKNSPKFLCCLNFGRIIVFNSISRNIEKQIQIPAEIAQIAVFENDKEDIKLIAACEDGSLYRIVISTEFVEKVEFKQQYTEIAIITSGYYREKAQQNEINKKIPCVYCAFTTDLYAIDAEGKIICKSKMASSYPLDIVYHDFDADAFPHDKDEEGEIELRFYRRREFYGDTKLELWGTQRLSYPVLDVCGNLYLFQQSINKLSINIGGEYVHLPLRNEYVNKAYFKQQGSVVVALTDFSVKIFDAQRQELIKEIKTQKKICDADFSNHFACVGHERGFTIFKMV